MPKKVKAYVKLALPAGKAAPAPPVGPALGQHGINIANFCKEYNAKTSDKIGMVIPVKITIYEDKSFSIELKTPPTSALISKFAEIKKGSKTPSKNFVGTLNHSQLEEIARLKLLDLNTSDIGKAIKCVLGTAKNMGIDVKE